MFSIYSFPLWSLREYMHFVLLSSSNIAAVSLNDRHGEHWNIKWIELGEDGDRLPQGTDSCASYDSAAQEIWQHQYMAYNLELFSSSSHINILMPEHNYRNFRDRISNSPMHLLERKISINLKFTQGLFPSVFYMFSQWLGANHLDNTWIEL